MKCSGVIGYARTEETQPSVWTEVIEERKYYGDIIRNNRRFINDDQINSGISLNNSISIVSNKFMLDNLGVMKYLTFKGSKWKIESVEIQPPRIIITLGGLYNE